ncbi:MAG: hypothetical protein IPO92_04145 [Saprospiraceae bacterium]|nr:hypothetical protein [Saprospiraceae bacterium]
MLKLIVTCILLVSITSTSSACGIKVNSILLKIDTVTWPMLNNLEYKEKEHKEYGTVYLPEFSKEIKNLANKRIQIRGYLVPVDKTTWALSKNTYAACFFCGKAGPETVIGLTFNGDPGKLKMDANAVVTGKFILNGTNVDDWMYSLVDVEIVSIKMIHWSIFQLIFI